MGRDATQKRIRSAHWVVAVAVALAAVAIGAIACSSGGSDAAGRLRVVTSLELLADMARQVGGDRIDVNAILPSGADPHTFEAAPGRVADIARADLLFVNGLGLEGNLLDVIAQNAGGPVVRLTDGLDTIDGNPHLWLDASLAASYVGSIRDALIEQDPAGSDTYTANASAYLGVLAALDVEIAEMIDAIPPDSRRLVTFHNAYLYLAQRYGLEVVGFVVPSPGQEPNPGDVAGLVDAIRDQDVRAVFKEPQFNASVLELAADEADVRVLDLLSDAYADGVGSYVELMRFNAQQLKEGLGGD